MNSLWICLGVTPSKISNFLVCSTFYHDMKLYQRIFHETQYFGHCGSLKFVRFLRKSAKYGLLTTLKWFFSRCQWLNMDFMCLSELTRLPVYVTRKIFMCNFLGVSISPRKIAIFFFNFFIF